jgi:hypothetical protein
MPRDVEKTTPFEKSGKTRPATMHQVAKMFGNFEAAKKRKLPKWAAPLLASMLAFHVVLFVTMWVKTIWDIEQLERPKTGVDLAIAPPPPPPFGPRLKADREDCWTKPKR